MKKLLLLLLWLTAAQVRTVAQERDNDDIQLWPDVTVSVRLNPTVALNFFGTLRFGQDVSARITHQVGAAASFRVNDYLSFASAYRHAWSYPTPTRRSRENRYFWDVTPRLPLPKGFTLSDRNRGEVRDIGDQVSWRYRNRIQLDKALSWHEHEITPYVASEFHYESRYQTWNRKMIWAGARVPVHKHVTLDIHYSHTWDARARPGYWDVVGLMTRMEF